MATEQAVRRPFHETIVEVIRLASSDQLECLATLIKATKIPKGHEEIIVAWKKRRQQMAWYADTDLGVTVDLIEQRQEAREKEAAKVEEEKSVVQEEGCRGGT